MLQDEASEVGDELQVERADERARRAGTGRGATHFVDPQLEDLAGNTPQKLFDVDN